MYGCLQAGTPGNSVGVNHDKKENSQACHARLARLWRNDIDDR